MTCHSLRSCLIIIKVTSHRHRWPTTIAPQLLQGWGKHLYTINGTMPMNSSQHILGFNIQLHILQVISETTFTASHLTGSQSLDWCKKPVFLTTHLAATSKTNITTNKWQHKNLNNNQWKLLKYAKLNLTKLKSSSSRLLHHPARKWIGSLLQLSGPAQGILLTSMTSTDISQHNVHKQAPSPLVPTHPPHLQCCF